MFARHNAFQVSTDDDERDLTVMMFDDSFAEANPDRVALFLHNELDLPIQSSTASGKFSWSGKSEILNSKDRLNKSVYCIFIVLEHGAWLSSPKGVFQFVGIDLSSLAEELRKPVKFNQAEWPSELRMLRSIAIRQPELTTAQLLERFIEREPFDNLVFFGSWQSGKCVDEWFLGDIEQVELDFSKIEKPLNERINLDNANHSLQISDNFVRIGYHFEDEKSFQNSCHLAMYFFDDLWAQANPSLATSLLYYGSEEMCLFDSENPA